MRLTNRQENVAIDLVVVVVVVVVIDIFVLFVFVGVIGIVVLTSLFSFFYPLFLIYGFENKNYGNPVLPVMFPHRMEDW